MAIKIRSDVSYLTYVFMQFVLNAKYHKTSKVECLLHDVQLRNLFSTQLMRRTP